MLTVTMAHDWIHIGNILFTLCTVHRNIPTQIMNKVNRRLTNMQIKHTNRDYKLSVCVFFSEFLQLT